MSDPALSILIDSSGAEAGAKRVQAALAAISESAARTIQAIQALNNAQVKGGGASPAGGGAAAKADVAAHDRAEQQKTAITRREQAKRTSTRADPQVARLQSDVASLSAALSRIAPPKLDASSIKSEIRSVNSELNKLAKVSLSGMADGGAAKIADIQARVEKLNKQLAQVSEIKVKADTSQAKVQQAKSEYKTLAPPPVDFKTPQVDTAKLKSEFQAVGREIEKLGKADLSKLGDGGEASVKALQARVESLKAQLSDVNKLAAAAKVQAPRSAQDLSKIKSDFAGIKAGADQVSDRLKNLKLPASAFAPLRTEIAATGKEIDKLSKTSLSRIGDGGAAAIERLKAKVAGLNQQIAAQHKSISDFANRTGGQTPSGKSDFVGPRTQTQAIKAEQEATRAFEKESRERIKIWQKSEAEQARHTAAEARLAAAADRARRSLSVPASSPAFVGPMPETRQQQAARRTTSTSTPSPAKLEAPPELAPVKAKATGFEAVQEKISALSRAISGAKNSSTVKVAATAAGIKDAQAQIDALMKQLDRLKSTKASSVMGPEASAGISKVRGEVRALQDQLARLGRMHVSPTITPKRGGGGGGGGGGGEDGGGLGFGAGAAVGGVIKGSIRGPLSGTLGVANMAMAGGIAGTVAALAKITQETVKVRANFQDLETRFKTLTGSASSSAETMSYLSTTSQKLSTDTVDLANSYTKFLPMVKEGSVSLDQARTMLEGMVDIQKATGASTGQLNDAMYGLAQTLSMPKANIEQLNQVTEPLPGLLGAMDRAATKLYPSIAKGAGSMRELTEAGRVSSAVFRDVLIEAMKEYAGAAEATHGNISSTLTRLKNAWNELLNTLGTKLETPIIGVLELVTLGIQGLQRTVGDITYGIEAFAAGVARVKAMMAGMSWDEAKAANPSPDAPPSLSDIQDRDKPKPGAPTSTTPAPLLPGKPKKQTKEERIAEDFANDKGLLEKEIATQKAINESYDRGRGSSEQYRNALKDLNMEQALVEKYGRKRADTLMELAVISKDAEEIGAYRKKRMEIQEVTAQTEAMAAAYTGTIDDVKGAEAAQKGFSDAVALGMSARTDVVNDLTELNRVMAESAGKAELAKQIFQVDLDIGSIQAMITAYTEDGVAIDKATDATQAYAIAVQAGATADTVAIEKLAEKLGMLRRLRAEQDQIKKFKDQDIDIATGEKVVSASQSQFGTQREDSILRAEVEGDIAKRGLDPTSANSQREIDNELRLNQLSRDAAAANDELSRMASYGENVNLVLRDAAAGGIHNFSDELLNFADGSKTAKEAFTDFARSTGRMLMQMAIQMTIMRGMSMLFGAAIPVGGGATGMPMPLAHSGGVIGKDNLPRRNAPSFHSGGIVGSDRTAIRSLPTISLPQLPKYHTGGIVGGNEQPALLKRGEGVFTENQMKALAPSGGGAITVAPNISVNAPPGGSAEDGERFGKAMSRQIEETIVGVLQKQLRNGGTLNPNGMGRM